MVLQTHVVLAIFVGLFILAFSLVIAQKTGRRKNAFLPITYSGDAKERLAWLDLPRFSQSEPMVFKRISKEVKLFNRMRFVLPCIKGSPEVYIYWLGRLYKDPSIAMEDQDPIQRLFYLYACLNLYVSSSCELTKRQLLKNALVTFISKPVIKIATKICKIVSRRYYVLCQPQYSVLIGKGQVKVLARDNMDDFLVKTSGETVSFSTKFSDSYACYGSKNLLIRNYVDEEMPVECYEITAKMKTAYEFVWRSKLDKSAMTISHTADSIFVFDKKAKACFAVYVSAEHAELGTNLARKSAELDINVTAIGNAKVFIIKSKTKTEVAGIISHLKKAGDRCVYLLSSHEIEKHKQVSELLNTAYSGRYVVGNALRRGFLCAQKKIPTLFLPTLVYNIETEEEFFKIEDMATVFCNLARCSIGLNVVILYSSQNDMVREIITAFSNKAEIKEMVESGVFFFFVDKMRVHKEAVAYFFCMIDAQKSISRMQLPSVPISNNKKIQVSRQTSGNILSIFLNNVSNKNQACTIHIPLRVGVHVENALFPLPSIISRNGNKIKITNQKTGRSYSIKIPTGATALLAHGQQLGKGEYMSDRIILTMDVQVKSLGEKIVEIKKSTKEGIDNIKNIYNSAS